MTYTVRINYHVYTFSDYHEAEDYAIYWKAELWGPTGLIKDYSKLPF